ncbi:BRICHOS domain-containing protein 5 [Aptenodytes patagonicus]|uniref:BRICHOS domain-containing protein 5 n=1 Tax=Aptenodytes patagonicus TaxID=9234 RepID=UPI003FA02576
MPGEAFSLVQAAHCPCRALFAVQGNHYLDSRGKCSAVGVLATGVSDLKLQHWGTKVTLFRGCGDVLAVLHSNPSSLQSDLCREREVHFHGEEEQPAAGLIFNSHSFFCLGPQDRRAAARFAAPSRTFWIILSVALFFAAVGISVVGVLSFSPSSAQAGSQLVRLTLQGQQDPLRNQTALVDKSRSTVTYYITSQSNHTAVVLYDSRNGYVCYKPVEQRACYLRRMDAWDLQTLQTSLNASEQRADQMLRQNNQTKYYREFLGILAGEQVDPENLGEAVRTLCEQTSIFWVRRGEGPGKQRLIYLCIDICFPSNICVSICFYYLPE